MTQIGTNGNDAANYFNQADPDVYALDGDDTVVFDAQENDYTNRYIDAGRGNDVVHSGSGRDVVYGGEGDDIIHSGSGPLIYLLDRSRMTTVSYIAGDTVHGG